MPQFEGHLVPSDMLRFVEEKLGAGIWRYDAAGQMQWSRGFYELLGLDPRKDAPSYAEMDRRIHPEDRRPKLDVSELMLDRSPLEGEFRIIRPNGTLRWVYNQAELLLDDSGKPSGILGVMFDITANRKKLQSLRTDAERYSALTQIALGLLWIGSSDGRITALPNAARMPQASLFFGRGWLDLLHGEERETALHQWSAAVEMRRPYTTEHRMRQPDGTYRWFRCSAVPVSNPDGNIREWVGVSIDVHDEKLASLAAASSRLTGAQIRAARGILNWSVKELAERTGISSAVIRRFEDYNDSPPMPGDTMEVLRNTLSSAGIEFLFSHVGKPGVRPR